MARTDGTVTFAEGLRAALEADPPRRRKAKRLYQLLDAKPSKKKERRLRVLERCVQAHLEDGLEMTLVTGPLGIDWSQVDWMKVLDIVLKIAMVLLPLLLLFI